MIEIREKRTLNSKHFLRDDGQIDNQCCVENCELKLYVKGYCSRHYEQIRKYRKIKMRSNRDRNETFIFGDYCEVNLYNRSGDVVARCKFDLSDLQLVGRYKWSLSCDGYAQANTGETVDKMHLFILGRRDGLVIDHINQNKLDNRRENLRFITQRENCRNCKKSKNNKSGFNGVYFSVPKDKWVAETRENYKKVYLGSFVEKNDAVNARKQYDSSRIY